MLINLQVMELDLLPFHLVPTYSSFQKSLPARNVANTATITDFYLFIYLFIFLTPEKRDCRLSSIRP